MFILYMNKSNVFNFLKITTMYKTPVYCLKYSEILLSQWHFFYFPKQN